MRKVLGGFVCVLLLLLAAERDARPGDAAGGKLKVGFVFNTPLGDPGWTTRQNAGRLCLQQRMPDVETAYVENVPEGADAERVITEMARAGNKLVVAANFGYMDTVIKVAEKFPNTVFLHGTGYKTAPNVSTYHGRMYQAQYLSGMVAGRVAKKDFIGFVAAVPIPEVVRDINAFTLGARSVNPKIKVRVVWVNAWYDPAREREAANALIDAGADVVANFTNSAGPLQAAEARKVHGAGYHADMRQFAPKAFLVASVWNWCPIFLRVAQGVKAGTWKTTQIWGSMAEGVVDISKLGPDVPKDIQDRVMKVRGEIIKGTTKVFTGPINDRAGAQKVPAGKSMSDGELLGFNWFVEGVEGTIPK